jgi:hypothetical protein
MTSESENQLLARRLLEDVANTGAVDRLSEFLAPEYVAHDTGIAGIEQVREHALRFRAAGALAGVSGHYHLPPAAQIRNPRAETRKKAEYRRPKPCSGISDFGFRPSFGPRISGFGFGPLRSRVGGTVQIRPALAPHSRAHSRAHCLSEDVILSSAMFNKLSQSVQAIAGTFIVTTILLGVVSASGEETKSKLQSDPAGWVDILPSADLKGWYRVPVPPTGKLGREQWHVDAEKKVLICDGDGGHDMLLFDKEIGDAIFHFEFCYTKVEGKTGYNSGAYVRNSKDGAIWHQAQFGDAKDGYLFGETPAADGKKKWFNLSKQVTDMRVKPAGEWNTLEVTAVGKVLTLWVNGAVTCQFEECGREKGYVGLEGEGYRIEFRNLKVKELGTR